MKSKKEEQTRGETTEVKGLNTIFLFAFFCAFLAAGIIHTLGYRMVASAIALPIVFLAITIPVFRKSREFEKADKDEMFNLAYGKICADMINSEVWAVLIIAFFLYRWGIPDYIVLAFVGSVIYGYTFFRYYRWLKRGSEK
jgi:hypothetical protein